MALDDVEALEVRRVHGAGTGAVVGVGVGYALFALALQSCGECDGFAVGPFLGWGAIFALPAGIVGALIGWAVGP